MMKPYEVVSYKGLRIVVIDISESKPDEAVAYFKKIQSHIAANPPVSVLMLADVTNARFNEKSAAAIKAFAAKNAVYIKASASIGSVGPHEVLMRSVERSMQQKIMPFDNRHDAMEWLINQE